jgi:hypothetical protein
LPLGASAFIVVRMGNLFSEQGLGNNLMTTGRRDAFSQRGAALPWLLVVLLLVARAGSVGSG